MAFDILKKEEEFYAINTELEMRTKELLKEVNTVMKIQDNLANIPLRDDKKISYSRILDNKFLENNTNLKNAKCIHSSQNTTVHNSKGDPNIPESASSMGTKAINHYFRSKINTMQNEYDKLLNEYKKKSDELKKLNLEKQKLAEEKEKWFQMCNSGKNTINKLENQVTALSSKLQAKENENVSLKKEMDQLKKELKSATLNLNTTEVRLNRAVEEIEKIKTSFKNAKQEEQDTKETHRKQINELTTALKRSEKYKSELITAFKKQSQLVDNLRRQKSHLEALKVAEMCDVEFTKLLDWKMEES